MTWMADYFVMCGKCNNLQWMDGKDLATAKMKARKEGWFISKSVDICPECVQKEKDKQEV